MTKYLHQSDWDEFENTFQEAYRFLVARNLEREIVSLFKEIKDYHTSNSRYDWIKERLWGMYEVSKAFDNVSEWFTDEQVQTIKSWGMTNE